MKNQKRIVMSIICALIVIFAVSCKDQIIEQSSALTIQLAGDNYRGIEVKNDPRYGSFLSFGSLEQTKKLSVQYLDELTQEELIQWSAKIGHGFESQLTIGLSIIM